MSGRIIGGVIEMEEHLLSRLRAQVPVLSSACFKGSSGRLGIVGGSVEYTGAPYFAAISSMRVGADLACIYCQPDASVPIKSYSPDLIVHPALTKTDDDVDRIDDMVESMLRLHTIVIGSGLGRQPPIQRTVERIIDRIRAVDMPMVLDGDALFLVSNCPTLIPDWSNVIMTPNAVEFGRLWKAVLGSDPPVRGSNPIIILPDDVRCSKVSVDHHPYVADTVLLAKQYPGVVIARKGFQDIITDGDNVWVCGWKGSDRRVSGQGDLLAGVCGTLLSWSSRSSSPSSPVDAAVVACITVREAAYLTFLDLDRSMLASDIVHRIGRAFRLFT